MADRSFAPTVGVGVAAAVLAAVAGSRRWASSPQLGDGPAGGPAGVELYAGVGEMPLYGALALVLLACWGVALVGRGRWRVLVVRLGALTALGLLATWVVGALTLQEQVAEALARTVGDPGADSGAEQSWTTWFWVAGPAALLALGSCVVASLRVRRWPAMGSRYEAPTRRGAPAGAPSAEDLGERDPAELWKALDEGRDPTG